MLSINSFIYIWPYIILSLSNKNNSTFLLCVQGSTRIEYLFEDINSFDISRLCSRLRYSRPTNRGNFAIGFLMETASHRYTEIIVCTDSGISMFIHLFLQKRKKKWSTFKPITANFLRIYFLFMSLSTSCLWTNIQM